MNRPFLRLPTLLLALLAAPGLLSAADLKPVVPAPVPTVITSTSMEMWSTDTETRSIFKENVTVTGNNLRITCDKLDVTAVRLVGKDGKDDKKDTVPAMEKFKTLVATGNVHIVQGNREVTCGRAEVFPGEDRVVLTEKPVVIDNDGPYVATGERIVLLRGERRVFGDNVRVQGPAIRDLGFDKDKPAQAPAPLPRPTAKP